MRIANIKPGHKLLFVVLFLLLVGYSLFQARALIVGPRIWITNIEDGYVAMGPLVIVEGQSENIAWLSLNDRQIFTDEEGFWSEKLIVSKGLNVMTMRARDRFGRETENQVRIILPFSPEHAKPTEEAGDEEVTETI